MSFTFDAYRKFKKELGYFDATNEVVEISIREFADNANNSGNVEAFINNCSVRQKVKTNFYDLAEVKLKVARNYIVAVHSSFEYFLDKLKEEHEKFTMKKWISKEDTENKLKYFLRVSPIGYIDALKKVNEELFELCEYYRDIRNNSVHIDLKEERKLIKMFEKVSIYKSDYQKKYGINNAPNDFQNICFDDFILFSRVVKDVGHSICQIFRPSDELIAELVDIMDIKTGQTNEARKKNAILGRLKTLFGINDTEADNIIKYIDYK